MEEIMEVKKKQKLNSLALGMVILLMLWSSMATPALGCSSNGSGGGSNKNGCKDCLVDQMKYGCPRCVPLLRCMARCMWGGASRSRCINRCDCNGGKPSLSDCKKCMSRCKCSCVA
ncbi:BAG family molecular chaperone regulator 5 [Hibiscus syriacus]|uniref:BAG family molecular chaperone regulator 5 n=1 Tax=Hibiscus syriacus TaxID=106335 RepID=A0A6A3BGG5_HIBSY|nr:keratin-associated protein 5-2 [Hibiscus syriacus]KAE8715147.1 BAG family molecular chaperone regulator 5 [Hibiscus syriacus]